MGANWGFPDSTIMGANTMVWRQPVPDPMMVLARLGFQVDDMHPFQFLHIHRRARDDARVLVFILNDEPHTLVDDSGMFPCDHLIAQLRMLLP